VPERARSVLDWQRTTVAPRFPLRGGDLVALGVPPGPRVGAVLAAVEDWWIAGDFTADRDACLAKARELIADG
jgi:poly(A) polymerase